MKNLEQPVEIPEIRREIEKTSSSIPELPEKPQPELIGRIDEEFEKFKEKKYTGIKEAFMEASTKGTVSADMGEEIIKKMEEKYAKFGFREKVLEMSNNFYQWWPGGYMEKISNENQRLSYNKEKLKALDKVIEESGYKNDSDLALVRNGGKTDEEKTRRLMIIAEVYLKMLSLGYKSNELGYGGLPPPDSNNN